MARKVIAFISALVTWVLVASLLNRLLRVGLTGYTEAELTMVFTLAMKWARLALGALASLSAGFVLGRIAPNSGRLALFLGVLVLAAFLPIHYIVWDKFPIWYHGAFLLSIVPLVLAGARLGAPRERP